MSDRMQMLEDAMQLITKYTKTSNWRPGLMDLWVYDQLIGMHESDYDNGTDIPDFIWHKTPDEVMQQILIDGPIFEMQYGWDDFNEQVRNYLIYKNFIVDPMDEEYNQLTERSK